MEGNQLQHLRYSGFMPVWGSFSVWDHCQPGAFLREVLLFDKLAVPYPNPYAQGEWDRWRKPDPKHPNVTWDPDRLDLLLSILGDEDRPGFNGAQRVQRVMWDPSVWSESRSRLEAADRLSGNPYYDTALGVSLGTTPGIPNAVQAVAAYASHEAWEAEVKPSPGPLADTTAAEALVQLARPYLIPEPDGDELDQLREVVEMSMNPQYEQLRSEYYDWFRRWLGPLRQSQGDLYEVTLDPASMNAMEQDLRQLWEREKSIVREADRHRRWIHVEAACVSAGAVGTAAQAVALTAPATVLTPLGLSVAVLGFAGWAISRRNRNGPPQGLSGASLFVRASLQRPWTQPV